jgi:uncharacterized lipoprotein NlpE involved in copper resistance
MFFAVAIASPVAGADPTHAKNSTLITADCGGQMVTVSVNGNGEFTPAHDVASSSVFVPTAFVLTFTFTPTGGAPEPETDTSSKAAPIADTVTCDIPLQTLFAGPEGVATIEGTVTGFWTPR